MQAVNGRVAGDDAVLQAVEPAAGGTDPEDTVLAFVQGRQGVAGEPLQGRDSCEATLFEAHEAATVGGEPEDPASILVDELHVLAVQLVDGREGAALEATEAVRVEAHPQPALPVGEDDVDRCLGEVLRQASIPMTQECSGVPIHSAPSLSSARARTYGGMPGS